MKIAILGYGVVGSGAYEVLKKYLENEYTCPNPASHKVNPNANHGLQLIVMCQYWFINCTKCTRLGRDADGGETMYFGERKADIWELPRLPAQFCCDLETAVKNKVY